ncbi:MAG: hypothetical protein R5N72_09530 [Cutibacterium granulosum]|uniref:hypothetical protein n=1 Tax=Cutibacterium granulosum TaxID=33011 RepID=UPI002B2290F5|nr:hypothetical protein [Cutibacterium granulosum]MEA5659994.1 hypothetical protein [Cutibacterium granulosum]MEA5662267.1 hypothetical protein [Cutibacterium granulosum]
MARPVIHAAIPEELADWITRREELRHGAQPLSRASVSELQIFHDIMTAELARHRWSLAELEIIARSTMGTPPGPGVPTAVGVMFAAVYDARRAGEVADDDATTALLDKLGGLSPAADMALAYAVAAWRSDDHQNTAADWATVGIIVNND